MADIAYYCLTQVRSHYSPSLVTNIMVSNRCVRCTGWKACGPAFCESCYHDLPVSLRTALAYRKGLDRVEAIHNAITYYLLRDAAKVAPDLSDPNYDPAMPPVLFPDLPKPIRH